MSRGKRTFDQFKYQYEYNCSHYDRVSFRVKRGQKDLIKEAADRNGKSVNEFINDAVAARLAAL